MTDKTKKIIAREGLILISAIAIFLFGFVTGTVFDDYNLPLLRDIIGVACVWIAAFGYLIYLLTRFIIWAVKTLGSK